MQDGKKLILDTTRDGGKVTIKIAHQDESLYGAGFIGEISGPPPLQIHSTSDLPPAATYRHVWIMGNPSHPDEIVTWFDSGIAAEAWVDRLEELVDAINDVTDTSPDAGNMVGTSPNWEIGEQREVNGQWYECRKCVARTCSDAEDTECINFDSCHSKSHQVVPFECDDRVLIAIDPPTGDSPIPERLRQFAKALRDAHEELDAEDADTIMEMTPEETFRTALATVRYAAGRLARVADELAYSSDECIAEEVTSVNRLMTDFQRAAKFFGHAETRQTVAKLHTWTPEDDTE